MSRWDTLQSEITDVEFQLQRDNIKIIPVRKNQKRPSSDDYYNKQFPLTQLQKHNGNFGITVGYNHNTNNKSIAVIDIDGYSKESDKYKKQTQQLIFDALCKNLPVPAMMVRTQSGGYHIYLWNETVVDNIHEVSKHLHFPSDFEIKDLQGKPLWKSIEIFTKWRSKQCVLPTSTIKTNEYRIINDVHSFSSIGTVNNIHTIVKNALLKEGYTYQEEDTNTTNTTKKTDTPIELRELTKNETKELANTLTPYFTKGLDGDKHNTVFALGGYLSRFITEKSALKVLRQILRQTNNKANEPKHTKTLSNNYSRKNERKTGLPTLLENIKWHYPNANIDKLTFEIRKTVDPNYNYSFPIKQYNNNKIKYLSIDYYNEEIRTFTKNKVEHKDKETGEIQTTYYKTDEYTLFNLRVDRLYEAYNILDNQAKPTFCFKYHRKTMPFPQTIKADSIEYIEKELKRRPGIVLKPRETNGMLNEIIKEYIKLEQVETVTEVPVAGIFINPLTGKLIRTNNDGEIEIKKPKQNKVKQAFQILSELPDVYAPIDEKKKERKRDLRKLSHILRHGIIVPFSYILKTEHEWLPILVCYGASQTAKTTLAEISLCFWVTITDEVSLGGSSVDSPYRMGNALSRHGHGIIINEPGNVLEKNSDLLDLIKRSVESETCREKMENGVHVKIPAYSNMIITSNNFVPKTDALVRRIERIDFYKSERLTDDDKKLFKDTFNHNNWKDTDFLKLKSIGDYVVYLVSEDLSLLELDHKDFIDTMLDKSLEFAGLSKNDYSWLYETADLVEDMNSSDDYIVDNFRLLVMEDYTRNYSRIKPSDLEAIYNKMPSVTPNGDVDDNQEVLDNPNEDLFKASFIWMVEHEWFSYLTYHKKEDKVGIRSIVSDALERYDIQITAGALAEMLGTAHKTTTYKGKSMRLSQLPYDDFRRIIR